MFQKKHASRSSKQMTFDFAGRRIVEEEKSFEEFLPVENVDESVQDGSFAYSEGEFMRPIVCIFIGFEFDQSENS